MSVGSVLLTAGTGPAFAGPDRTIVLRVDLGEDIGQNFGTLFEAVGADGKVVAGAGFLGSYNTQARSDRRLLHVFVKPNVEAPFEPRGMPRANDDAGTYLFEFDNRLFSKGRGGKDSRLRVWDAGRRQWTVDEKTVPFSVHVGNGVLTSEARAVRYNGRVVLELKPEQGLLGERYYANGFLVFRRHAPEADPPVNELVAGRWDAGDSGPLRLDDMQAIAMGTPREFVYAYGQLESYVVAATNTGGVYTFDGRQWNTVLAPDVNVSFQIYAMVNYHDKLLMGQYPTGELFSFDGKELKHLPGMPPVMPGVRKSAREAQTLTIYGGALYAGVWPWGELWRLDDAHGDWRFLGRMFTHPAPTDETTHPYEVQTTRLGSVLNRWGQRVTSLVPLGDTLYISTSAKSGAPYEPKFTFLGEGRWKQYGALYHYRVPGSLAVHTDWTDGPTTFAFRFGGGRLTVLQDGERLGETDLPDKPAGPITATNVNRGQGLFGPFRGRILQHEIK